MKARSFVQTNRPVVCALVLYAFVNAAIGQQAAERFIPIGFSPGVSGESSYIGQIVEVDGAGRRLTVEDGRGRHTVRISAQTSIWIDRSAGRRTNLEGSFADCEVGRRVEIRSAEDDASLALWVKIEAR